MDICGKLFTGHMYTDPKDKDGCLKESNHDGDHVFKATDGRLISWDYDWNCDCPDCHTDNFSDMCMVYSEVKSLD